MRLKRLELQGFKTFAQKTTIEFPERVEGQAVTAIVGPNGSGKSNIADAIRWVMGEQSLRLLRSKKSEDVIFSGTEKRARSGFAEVHLTLENDHQSDIDMAEVVITRRLYRDGQSEYEINKQSVRLADVTLLLAQCGVGQRTYSVIGQGMVDAILVASPSERKEFFDEAAGLKVFQLKRQQATNKLDATQENLKQADLLLHEIEPRLASLTRQVKRLQERDGVEKETRRLERFYFGRMWQDIRKRFDDADRSKKLAETAFAAKLNEAAELEKTFSSMEKTAAPSTEIREWQVALDALREEKSKMREEMIRLESKREVAKIRAEKPWSPLPLSKIIEAVQSAHQLHDELDDFLKADKPDLNSIRNLVTRLRSNHADLLSRLQRPAPEPDASPAKDPVLEAAIADAMKAMEALQSKISETETKICELQRADEQSRSSVFEQQRRLNQLQHEVQRAEQSVSTAAVEMARQETRREAFLSDLRSQAPQLEAELENLKLEDEEEAKQPLEALQGRLHRLRSQLEWIGGIDPAILEEHTATEKRFKELSTQTEDLRQAIASLETVILELDTTIQERGKTAFEKLNTEFGSYFRQLFGGGEARLIQLEEEPSVEDEDAGENAEEITGIDLQATPPGKRLKGIALLSGGERALTSIALICAIMATNPSPFVVLDEVDAALDESNSKKFADILEKLSHTTQFVVITHNRATMQTAQTLYGVTMGDEGSSRILSLNLAT